MAGRVAELGAPHVLAADRVVSENSLGVFSRSLFTALGQQQSVCDALAIARQLVADSSRQSEADAFVLLPEGLLVEDEPLGLCPRVPSLGVPPYRPLEAIPPPRPLFGWSAVVSRVRTRVARAQRAPGESPSPTPHHPSCCTCYAAAVSGS